MDREDVGPVSTRGILLARRPVWIIIAAVLVVLNAVGLLVWIAYMVVEW